MDVSDGTAISIQWLDYFIIGTVLSISASIGVYYRFTGNRQKTSQEYFSANRSTSVPLISIALMVAFMSATSMLGASAETYIFGAQHFLKTLGYLVATPIVAYLYLPVFFKLRHMSVYEYLEKRFGAKARLSASIANFVQTIFYTGIFLYAPALALEATTGLSSTTSILLIGLVSTIYSSIGGIKAVLVTDVFQSFLVCASILLVVGVGCYDIEGGISAVLEIAAKARRLDIYDLDTDMTTRHSWWSLTIGSCCIYISSFAVSQVHVQRLLSAKSLRSAQIALFLNTPIIIAMIIATIFSGLVLYAWFEGCDPVAAGQISSFNQIIPYFAKIRMSKIPGLTGLFVAGVYSGALSTVSATLNSLSAVAIGDYMIPIYRKFDWEFSDSKATFFGKIICTVNGLLCVAVAFLTSGFGSLMETWIAISGAFGGPILGLFSLGIFIEAANEKGAVIGTLLSLGLSAWMTFGLPKPPLPYLPVSIDECSNSTYLTSAAYEETLNSRNADDTDYFYLYRISYIWYTPIGMATTMLFGYIASTVVCCLSRNSIAQPDPDLFSPILVARMKRRREAIVNTGKSVDVVSSDLQIYPSAVSVPFGEDVSIFLMFQNHMLNNFKL